MGERVSIASNGGTGEGYLALPQSGTGSAVIVIQEWWGLVGHITNPVAKLRGVRNHFADLLSATF